MSPSLERRAGWVAGFSGRLFGGAAPAGWPPAWLALVRDPVQLGEDRWGELFGAPRPAVDPVERRRGSNDVGPGPAGVRPAARSRDGARFEPSADWIDGPPNQPKRAAARPAGVGSSAPSGGAAGSTFPTRYADPAPPAPNLRALPASAARAASAHAGMAAPDRAAGRPVSAPAGRPIAPAPLDAPFAGAPAAPAQPATSRLVQGAAGLGRLLALAPGRAALDAPGRRADAPPRFDTAWPEPVQVVQPQPAPPPLEPLPTPPTPVAAPAALDLDTILEALTDRLRVDYLRHYGSAG